MFTSAGRLHYETKENGLTCSYIVDIDSELLKKVVKELDKKCVKNDAIEVHIKALDEEEANNNFEDIEGVLVQEVGTTLNLKTYRCIIPIKKYTMLAKIIQVILDIHFANDKAHMIHDELGEQSTKILDKFINYSPKDEEAGFDYITIERLYDTASRGIRLIPLSIRGLSRISDQPAKPLEMDEIRGYSADDIISKVEKRMKF